MEYNLNVNINLSHGKYAQYVGKKMKARYSRKKTMVIVKDDENGIVLAFLPCEVTILK